MAILNKGTDKNRTIKVVQFCNDWISGMLTVQDKNFPTMTKDVLRIYEPSWLDFTDEEKTRINLARDAGKTGIMFSLYEWSDSNTLRKLPKQKQ